MNYLKMDISRLRVISMLDIDEVITKDIHMIITKNEKIEARRILKEIYASINLNQIVYIRDAYSHTWAYLESIQRCEADYIGIKFQRLLARCMKQISDIKIVSTDNSYKVAEMIKDLILEIK